MKIHYPLFITILLFACSENKPTTNIQQEPAPTINQIIKPTFQAILDSAKVKGAILLYDFQKDEYYSNDFVWANTGQLPASTFKIANSIIALETGVVANDSLLFKWDGERRGMKIWEQDLIFSKAFQLSCVPCYQEVARNIGEERMQAYLDKLSFGNMEFDSTNLDQFWLRGASRISPFQQIDFLNRLYHSKLPISKRTETILKNMMLLKATDSYRLSGKTGWSINGTANNGWFVGYVEQDSQLFFFATNIEPLPQFNMDRFPMIRKEVTLRALTLAIGLL